MVSAAQLLIQSILNARMFTLLLHLSSWENKTAHEIISPTTQWSEELATLPAIVLRNIKYSKLEISLLCQRWVILEDLYSCRGVASDILLEGSRPEKHS